jgi:hypothetical protein
MTAIARNWDIDRRIGGPRRAFNGPAVLHRPNGPVLHVDFVDLSAGGACVTRPRCGVLVGDEIALSGATMPWERTAKVVGLSPRGMHLAFVDGRR